MRQETKEKIRQTLLSKKIIKARPIIVETLSNGCIVPTNYPLRKKDGYIVVNRNNKTQYLHRYLYQQKYGKVSDKLVVRHLCNNPSCINMEHLIVGSQKDNIHDEIERNTFVRGQKNGMAKLKNEEVLEIRKIKGLSMYELAKKYNVSKSVIYSIQNNTTWRHLLPSSKEFVKT